MFSDLGFRADVFLAYLLVFIEEEDAQIAGVDNLSDLVLSLVAIETTEAILSVSFVHHQCVVVAGRAFHERI